jgi:hypothetical protein
MRVSRPPLWIGGQIAPYARTLGGGSPFRGDFSFPPIGRMCLVQS